MRPIDSLDDNTIPILFLHGEDDTFILPKNSMDMADRTKRKHELHLISKAGHAESILVEPALYRQYVTTFLLNDVPDRGQSEILQGELLRQLEKLRYQNSDRYRDVLISFTATITKNRYINTRFNLCHDHIESSVSVKLIHFLSP